MTGAGRDDTSKAGVPVSRPGAPGSAASLNAVPDTKLPAGSIPPLSTRFATLLEGFGIPKDPAAFFALRALMGEGLSLGSETIRAVRTAALRHAEPRRAAELAARALAAGLQPDDGGIDTLIRSLSGNRVEDFVGQPDRVTGKQSASEGGNEGSGECGREGGREGGGEGDGEGGGGGDSGKNQERDTGRESGKDPGHEPGKDKAEQPSQGHEGHGFGTKGQSGVGGQQPFQGQGLLTHECQDETELRKVLQSVIMDLSARAAADPGFSNLGRKGPDGRGWLCVPYRFSIDGVDFSGYFRIVFNYASRRVERLVAEIDSSGLTRIFDMSWGPAGKPALRFMPGSALEGDEFAQVFGALLKVEILRPGESPDQAEDRYREIDGHA